MKISLNDFLLSHKKTAGFEFVEKIFEKNQILEKPSTGKTFHLTVTGAEVHSGEPLVAQLNPVETLQQKIERFERLERNVNLLRMRAFQSGALELEEDSEEDFEFANDNGSDVDAFGDPIQDSSDFPVAEPEKGAGEPAQPSMSVGGVSSTPGAAVDVPPADASASDMPSQPKVEDVQK